MRFLPLCFRVLLILFLLRKIVEVLSHILTLCAQWEDLRIKKAVSSTILEMHRDYHDISRLLSKRVKKRIRSGQTDDIELYLRMSENGRQLCETSQSNSNLKPVFSASEESTQVSKAITHLLDNKE
ncbi:MAG: hypothetical protein E7335_11380 [Clostridiales bacterium]|nr:hypothetical protein [Clostridiales bacterium]